MESDTFIDRIEEKAHKIGSMKGANGDRLDLYEDKESMQIYAILHDYYSDSIRFVFKACGSISNNNLNKIADDIGLKK